MFLQYLNLISILIFPATYIYYRQPNPVGAFIAVCLYSIVCLKLFSYLHINYRCRQDLIEKKNGFKNLLFFPILKINFRFFSLRFT